MIKPLMNKLQHHIVTTAPSLLSFPTQMIPFSLQEKALQQLLSRIFKEAVEDGDVDFLTDKWLKVTISDINLTWYISFKNEAFVFEANVDDADVAFTAPVNDLIMVAGRKEDPDTLFFQRRLSIEGDTELGLEVKNLLDNIEFDSLPHYIQQGIQHFAQFIKNALNYQSTQLTVMNKQSQ